MRGRAAVLLLLAPALLAGEPPPLRVRLGGEPVGWRVHGAAPVGSAAAADGELIRLEAGGELVWPVSPGERELELVRVGETFVWRRAGEVVPFSARVYLDRRDRKAEPLLAGELPALTAEQRKHLRVVQVAAWGEAVAAALGELDLERCRIELSREALARGPGLALGQLPPGVRHLAIRVRAWRQGEQVDLSALGALAGLASLELELAPGLAVQDWSVLAGLRSLRTLIVRGGPPDLSLLAGMESLAALELIGCPAPDLAPLAGLAGLERVVLDGVRARSLAPLAGLPGLRVLHAARAALEELPAEGFAALRELDVMGCVVEEAAAARFRAAHPDCRVRCGWNALFAEVTRGVDRVRIRSGGTCHRHPAGEHTLLELEGEEAAAFLAAVEVEEDAAPELLERLRRDTLGAHDADGDGRLGPNELPADLAARLGLDPAEGLDEPGLRRVARRLVRSGARCRCCGDPSFELHRQGALVATLGFHHAQSLRWPGGWPSDAALTPASRAALSKLVQRARPGPVDRQPPPVFEGGR